MFSTLTMLNKKVEIRFRRWAGETDKGRNGPGNGCGGRRKQFCDVISDQSLGAQVHVVDRVVNVGQHPQDL